MEVRESMTGRIFYLAWRSAGFFHGLKRKYRRLAALNIQLFRPLLRLLKLGDDVDYIVKKGVIQFLIVRHGFTSPFQVFSLCSNYTITDGGGTVCDNVTLLCALPGTGQSRIDIGGAGCIIMGKREAERETRKDEDRRTLKTYDSEQRKREKGGKRP
jgi:hypothetical protein